MSESGKFISENSLNIQRISPHLKKHTNPDFSNSRLIHYYLSQMRDSKLGNYQVERQNLYPCPKIQIKEVQVKKLTVPLAAVPVPGDSEIIVQLREIY